MMVAIVAISKEFVRSGSEKESSNSIDVTQSQDSTFERDNPADCEGEELLPGKKVLFEDEQLNNKSSFDDEQCYAMQEAVVLNTSGLRRSNRIQKQNTRQSPEPASRIAFATKPKETSKLGLRFFSLFCTITVHTSSALSTTMQAPVKSTRHVTSYMLPKTVKSFHKVNTVYAGTLNDVSTPVMAAISSNEVFIFKQAMNENDSK
jgi:hypothetical protein